MPNGKFPKRAAKRLGISEKQLETGYLVEKIGNPYSGSAMLGLVRVLEEGRKGQKVLVTSYGSGAGSDSLSLTVNKKLGKKYRLKQVDLKSQLEDFDYINYPEYLMIKEQL